jgi:hypothetical protein
MQSDSQQDSSPDVIEPGRKYKHDEHCIIEVKGFSRNISSIDPDGTVNERVSVKFNINPVEGPIWDGEEPNVISQEYKQFLQSVEPVSVQS